LPLLLERMRRRYPQLHALPALGDAPEILQAITDWILRAAGTGGDL